MSLALAAFFVPQGASAQGMSLPYETAVTKTGSAHYSIPIAVAPGTSGIAPPLALTYDSQAGNGLLGMGWQLEGLPSIGRCPRTVATDGAHGGVAFDANDRFCLNDQRLIAISGVDGADGTEYRTELESFTKVISHGTAGTGPAWFEVKTKAGQLMEFGNSTDSRIMQQSTATARAWAVNKVSDTKGNYFTVSYANSSSQTYPTRIDYTGNAAAGLTPYNSVRFVYESRPDPVPTFLGGATMQTTVRMSNLQVYAEATLVSDYRFAYAQGSATGRSQLTSLTLCGADSTCLPVTSFTWQQGNENGRLNFTSYGVTLPGLPKDSVFTGDWNGDGLTDLKYVRNQNGPHWYINNGLVDGAITFTELPLDYGDYAVSSTVFGDWNGDGLTDTLYIDGRSQYNHFYINNSTAPEFTSYGVTLPGLPKDSVFTGDWNGDGLTDLKYVRNQNGPHWYINNGLVDGAITFTELPLDYGDYAVSSTVFGDWNGDGLTDTLYIDGRSQYNHFYINNGTHPDLVTRFRSGFGATTSITYKPLTGTGVYIKDTGTNAAVAPMLDLAASHWVVSHVDQSDGIGGQRGWDYSYAGAKVDMQGRGFLGFRQRTVTDLRTGIATTGSNRQDFPFAGLTASETSTLGALTLSAITNSYGAINLGGTRRQPFLSQSVATRTDLDGTVLPGVTTSYQYDAYGNATQITAATSDGFSKTTTNSYSNDEVHWLLGRLTRATAVNQTP